MIRSPFRCPALASVSLSGDSGAVSVIGSAPGSACARVFETAIQIRQVDGVKDLPCSSGRTSTRHAAPLVFTCGTNTRHGRGGRIPEPVELGLLARFLCGLDYQRVLACDALLDLG